MSIDPMYGVGLPLAGAAAPLPVDRMNEHRELIRAVRALNAAELFGQNQELTFALDRESRRTVIRILDRNTREVIRQIPPEVVLRMAQDLSLLRLER